MNLQLRSDVMRATDAKTAYVARSLVCDGATAFDTGFKPFYGDDASANFKITLRIKSMGSNANQAVVLGCKYEGTTGGQQWPGIYIRVSGNNFEIGGYNYWKPTIASIVGKNLYIWRTGGKWYAQIDSETSSHSLSVRVATFNQPLVLGAGVQTNGTYFRYCKCNIDYVRIEYI